MRAPRRNQFVWAVCLSLTLVPISALAAEGDDSEQDQALRKLIETKKIAKIELVKTPLADAVDYLRHVTKLNIRANWNALQVAGLDKTTEVALQLEDVTIAKALRVLADDLGAAGAGVDFEVHQNVITLAPKAHLNRRTFTRIYDVQRLLRGKPDLPFDSRSRPPLWDAPPKPIPPSEKGRPGKGDQFFDVGDAPPPSRMSMLEKANDLIALITETVDPTSWHNAGGEVGAIRGSGMRLSIRQTACNHRRIAALLKALDQFTMLSVRARWVAVEAGRASALLGKLGPTKEVTAELLAAAKAETVFEGLVRGVDGQLVHLAKGKGWNVVVGLEPVVAESARAYRPVVEKVFRGVVLEVRPILSADRRQATLYVRSSVSIPAPQKPAPARKPAADVPADLDSAAFHGQVLSATLRAPVGKPVLAGAVTSANGNKKQVFLLLLETRLDSP